MLYMQDGCKNLEKVKLDNIKIEDAIRIVGGRARGVW